MRISERCRVRFVYPETDWTERGICIAGAVALCHAGEGIDSLCVSLPSGELISSGRRYEYRTFDDRKRESAMWK